MRNAHDGSGAGSSSATTENAMTASTKDPLKLMVVGDSMTHGNEGDYTWRYRLWEWFRDAAQTTRIQYVGPKLGTVPVTEPQPPQPPGYGDEPPPEDRDVFTGGYALEVDKDFKGYHFSQTGRAVWQAKDWIEDVVREYQPDMILVMLGFNDMAWCVSGPEDLFKNMCTFIDRARAARPDVSFVIGNVPQRSFMESHKDLFVWTSRYNSYLHFQLPGLSTKESRVEVAEIERAYGYVPDDSKGMYDGIHPNARGDYQISRAFSITLHEKYGFGSHPLEMPNKIPPRVLLKPKNPKALSVPYGLRFAFDKVYGSIGYDIRKRKPGSEKWNESVAMVNQVDDSWASEGAEFEFQARGRYGDEEKGEWSDVVVGTAKKETAPAPKNGKVFSLPKGFEATWDELEDRKWKVDRYAVLYADQAGGFLCGRGARGTSVKVEDLEPGHKFNIFLQTWTFDEGPGSMQGIGTVVVGSGVFSRPESERK